jgi:hypothetical protein
MTPRDVVLNIRTTTKTDRAIERQAAREERSKSQWVDRAIRKALGERLDLSDKLPDEAGR